MTQNMHTSLKVPTPLRPYTNGQALVTLLGETVNEALDDLVKQFPDMRTHLFNEGGKLRSFVNLYLNGKDIRHLEGMDTYLAKGDKLMIIPAIAGG